MRRARRGRRWRHCCGTVAHVAWSALDDLKGAWSARLVQRRARSAFPTRFGRRARHRHCMVCCVPWLVGGEPAPPGFNDAWLCNAPQVPRDRRRRSSNSEGKGLEASCASRKHRQQGRCCGDGAVDVSGVVARGAFGAARIHQRASAHHEHRELVERCAAREQWGNTQGCPLFWGVICLRRGSCVEAHTHCHAAGEIGHGKNVRGRPLIGGRLVSRDCLRPSSAERSGWQAPH